MDDIELVKRKLNDLALASFNRNIWEYSKFLNLAEQSELQKSKMPSKYFLYGGYENAERCIAVFGNEDDIGYPYFVPIAFIEIAPVNEKFADTLSHRDFLGALMSLGINRDMLGDILVGTDSAVLICIDSVADFIVTELCKIKHTCVKCKVISDIPEIAKPEFEYAETVVSSERIDVLISNVYNLSRNSSQALIKSEKVFCDNRIVVSTSLVPKSGQIISVRGHGRFIYDGVLRTTKKGRIVICIRKCI